MNFCGNCGIKQEAGHAFCGNCGTPVRTGLKQPIGSHTPSAPRPSPATAAPEPMADEGSGPSVASLLPQFPMTTFQGVVSRVLVGNWVGAGLVAGATLASTLLVATVVGLLLKSPDLAWSDTLTLITALAGSAYGGDAFVSTMIGDATFGVFPLGITLMGIVTGVLVFRRVTARYTSSVAALLDGVRAAVMVAVPLCVLALVFRSGISQDELTGDDAAAGAARDVFADFPGSIDLTAGQAAVGTLFMTFLVLTFVFALSVFMRIDWLGPKFARAHGWLAAPIAGVAAMMLLLPVAGLTAILAVVLVGDGSTASEIHGSDEWLRAIGVAFAALPNIGMAAMSLGTLGKVGTSYDINTDVQGILDALGGPEEAWYRLTKFTGDGEEPGLWILLIVVPTILLTCAYVVARRSTSLQVVFRNLLLWAGGMIVVVPGLVRMANVHAGFDGDFDELSRSARQFVEVGRGDNLDVSFVVGLSGVSSTVMLTLGALVAAVVIAALTGAIDLAYIGTKLASNAKRVQEAGAVAAGMRAQGPSENTPAAPSSKMPQRSTSDWSSTS